MFSDVVFEQIIKKKNELWDYVKFFLIVFLCLAVPGLIVTLVGGLIDPVFALTLSPYLFIAAVVLMIFLLRNMSYEYEYTFVNGELSIDKIIAKTKRKRMISFDVKNIDDMGIYDPKECKWDKSVTKLIYTDTYSGNGDLYMAFPHPAIGRCVVVIKSSEKIAKGFKPFVSRNIHKAVFPDV